MTEVTVNNLPQAKAVWCSRHRKEINKIVKKCAFHKDKIQMLPVVKAKGLVRRGVILLAQGDIKGILDI